MKTYRDGLLDAAKALREIARYAQGGLLTAFVSNRDILYLAANKLEEKAAALGAQKDEKNE